MSKEQLDFHHEEGWHHSVRGNPLDFGEELTIENARDLVRLAKELGQVDYILRGERFTLDVEDLIELEEE